MRGFPSEPLPVPALRALIAQLVGAIFVVLMVLAGVLTSLPPLALAAVQGVVAATVASAMRAQGWWLLIHLAFLPLGVFAARLNLPVWSWAAGFALLAVFYWTSFRTQVPLFLSNRKTVERLAEILPHGEIRVLDIGSGIGSFARRFARLRPHSQVTGIESAPAPALLARWLAQGQDNVQFKRGNFFGTDWSTFDVVYAFLSPIPMPEVWDKACSELPRGSLLVSNSFEVPGVPPTAIVEVGDRRTTRLYCYTIGADNTESRPKPHLIWPWSRHPQGHDRV